MRDVSRRWREAVTSADRTIVERVEVLNADGEVEKVLAVNSGDWSEDGTATVRHSATVELQDPAAQLSARSLRSLVRPPARRLRLVQGFSFPDGREEVVTALTGYVTRVSARSGGGALRVQVLDRMARLQRPSRRPVNIAGATRADNALRTLLWAADPALGWADFESLWTVPRISYEIETDLAAKAVEIAETVGAEVYVNRDDLAQFRPVPTAEGLPVAEFVEGETCTVLDAGAEFDWDEAHNGVIVTAQHSSMSEPVRGEAWAPGIDPDSPEAHARFVQTDKVTTKAQAETMAAGILEKELGAAEEYDLEILFNPALEDGDVVRVDLPSVEAEGLYVISQISGVLGTADSVNKLTIRGGVR